MPDSVESYADPANQKTPAEMTVGNRSSAGGTAESLETVANFRAGSSSATAHYNSMHQLSLLAGNQSRLTSRPSGDEHILQLQDFGQ